METICPNIWAKTSPKDANFWLMGVAQKCLCLSLLINNQPRGSLLQASLISSDLELREMYNIKATERQRQRKCHPKSEFFLFQTSLLLFYIVKCWDFFSS